MTKKFSLILLLFAISFTLAGCAFWEANTNKDKLPASGPTTAGTSTLKNASSTSASFDSADVKASTSSLPIDTVSWQVYRNEEVGLEFKYPANCVIDNFSENLQYDEGKRKSISVSCENKSFSPISFSYYSEDYKPNSSEGCCFVYGSAPINVGLPLDDLEILVKDFNPVNLRKVQIDGHEALKYNSIKTYDWFWVTDEIIMPANKNSYTNLIIASDLLRVAYIDDVFALEKGKVKNDLILKIKTNNFIEEKYQKGYAIYEEILKTVKIK